MVQIATTVFFNSFLFATAKKQNSCSIINSLCMCSEACNNMINEKMEAFKPLVAQHIKNDFEKLFTCLNNCLRMRFIKRIQVSHDAFTEDEMIFAADIAFTETLYKFKEMAVSGKLYDGNASVKTIINAVFSNKLREYLQTEKRLLQKKIRFSQNQAGTAGGEKADEYSSLEDLYLVLEQSLQEMKPADKELIIWRYLEGKSITQISELLGIGKASASNKLYRCITALRQSAENKLRATWN